MTTYNDCMCDVALPQRCSLLHGSYSAQAELL